MQWVPNKLVFFSMFNMTNEKLTSYSYIHISYQGPCFTNCSPMCYVLIECSSLLDLSNQHAQLLDSNSPGSLHPISMFPFVANLERAVYFQCFQFLYSSFKATLSRFSSHCSMETSHFKVTSDLQIAKSGGLFSIFVLVDLSATPDASDALLTDILSLWSLMLKPQNFLPTLLAVLSQFPLFVPCPHGLFIWGCSRLSICFSSHSLQICSLDNPTQY